MLSTNKKKLQWWGLDMGPRWRRRVAVIATYIAYLPLMAVAACDRWETHPYLAFFYIMVVTTLWTLVSVFRPNGLVKSFEDPDAPHIKMMRVNGLDEWARYRYGAAGFDQATEEQQKDLLNRYRVGTFLVPWKADPEQKLDEREKNERDRTEHWALKQVSMFLAIFSGIWLSSAARHKQVDPMAVAIEFWSFALLAQTLPQARVLWTEEYPRQESEETQMPQKQEV
jgi:hypothetical protein